MTTFESQRISGDRLRVEFDRSSLVFEPRENFSFQIVPHALEIEDPTSLRCHVELSRSRSDEPLWEQDVELRVTANGTFDALPPMTAPLPDAEGVYEINVSVYRKRFRHTFVRAKPIQTRKVQLVVIAPQPPVVDERDWELIEVIEPNQARWREWISQLPKLPLLPDFRQEPLANRSLKSSPLPPTNTSRPSAPVNSKFSTPTTEKVIPSTVTSVAVIGRTCSR